MTTSRTILYGLFFVTSAIAFFPIVSSDHISAGEECQWLVQDSGTSQQEIGLWGFTPTDIWASTRDSSAANAGSWQHYDGAVWTVVQTVAIDLLDTWGADPNDIWTGLATSGTVGPKHYTGTTWEDSTVATSGTRTWRGFWGPSTTEVYGVHSSSAGTDSQRIFIWDGLIWTLDVTSPATKGIFGIWGWSTGEIYIVGSDGIGGNGFVQKFDGAIWNTVTLPVGFLPNGGVWGYSENDVWVLGSTRILHIVNDVVTEVTNPLGTPFSDVYGNSATNVYFVGDSGKMLHWDGATISILETGAVSNIFEIWVATGGEAWASGNSGLIIAESCHPCVNTDSSDSQGIVSTFVVLIVAVLIIGAMFKWNMRAMGILSVGLLFLIPNVLASHSCAASSGSLTGRYGMLLVIATVILVLRLGYGMLEKKNVD